MPVIATDRTMLPLRVVVESLGVVVTYNAITRVIPIVWTHEGEAFSILLPLPQHEAEGVWRKRECQHGLHLACRDVDFARTRGIRPDLIGIE